MSQNWYFKRALEYFVSNLRLWYPSHHIIHCSYKTLWKAHQSHSTWSQRAHKQVATCSSHWTLPTFLEVATTQLLTVFPPFRCSWKWRGQEEEQFPSFCTFTIICVKFVWQPVGATEAQLALQPVLVPYSSVTNWRCTTFVRLHIFGGRQSPLLLFDKTVLSLSRIVRVSLPKSVLKAVNSNSTTIPSFAVIVVVLSNLFG